MTATYAERLSAALARRGHAITPAEAAEAVREATGAITEPLSGGERDFLLAHSGLSAADLSAESRIRDRAVLEADRAEAANRMRRESLTTEEVAEVLGRPASSVRRLKARGDLYGLDDGPGRGSRFPAWQFTGDHRVTPGLRAVVAALPDFWSPASVERFMTRPRERLDDCSPVDWLAQGGDVAPVVAAAAEQAWR